MSSPVAYRLPSMARPVVHFEIIGTTPAALREYYGELFGWEFEVGDTVTETVSQPGEYGFVAPGPEGGIPGGVGGGAGHQPRVLFYVGVPDVEEALQQAETLGGTRVMGPEGEPGKLIVGHFLDPEGNLLGVAGPQ